MTDKQMSELDTENIKVKCQCGWQGKQKDLLESAESQNIRFCPDCGADFPPFEFRSFKS